VDLRGNIDTRLRKAAETGLDAIVLAAAGLQRMGWQDRITQTFSVAELTPSPAQGALAIQARRGSDVTALLGRIDDPLVSRPVAIERAFLGALGAGCSLPVGAYVDNTPKGYRLTAMLADDVGERIAQCEVLLAAGREREHAAEIAMRLRTEVDPGRRSQWNGFSSGCRDLDGARVVVTRPRRQSEPLAAALRRCGAEAILLPTIRIEPVADTTALDSRLRETASGVFDWLVFTSANAVAVVAERLAALGLELGEMAETRVATVGAATAGAAEAARLPAKLIAEEPTAEGLAAAMIRAASPRAKVLYPQSAIGRDALPMVLSRAGMTVVTVAAYQTVAEDEIDAGAIERVRCAEVDVLTFASPSSVRALLTLLGAGDAAAKRIPVVCAGPTTADAAERAGFATVCRAVDASVEEMVAAASRLWRQPTMLNPTSGKPPSIAIGAETGLSRRSGD
jgi:uroporphyrinogen-III synthase